MEEERLYPKVPIAVSVLVGVAYGLFGRFVFGWGDEARFGESLVVMSVAFIFLVPLGVGFLTVYLAPAGLRRTFRYAVGMPFLMTLISLAALYATQWEGVICIVMMLPVFLVMSGVGGLIARALTRGRERNRFHAVGLASVLLLPYLAAPIEGSIPLAERERVVANRVRISADAAEVWRNIARVPPILPHEYRTTLVHRIGFPRPVEATLSHEGVGGVRHASFERGVVFIETVTEWRPGRLLSFTIHADPESIPAAALDQHVTVGGDHFDVLDGTYEIEPIAEGEVVLHLRSTHRLSTHFNFYAALWTDMVMRQVQQNILQVVRDRSEAAQAHASRP